MQNPISRIQLRSGGWWAFRATLSRPEKVFEEVRYDPTEPGAWDGEQPKSHDLFFTPLRFQFARRNTHVRSPGVLFADGDTAPLPPYELAPTILWWTSNGNWQAVWFLTEPIESYDRWADLNRRLTYALGADHGGWAGAKLLRVPGSYNYKRDEPGRLVHYDEATQYAPNDLFRTLPPVRDRGPSKGEGPHPELPTPDLSVAVSMEMWPSLPTYARFLLAKVHMRDRSAHIVRTAYELHKAGVRPETAFVLMWNRPWNKWRTDRLRPDMLWGIVSRWAE